MRSAVDSDSIATHPEPKTAMACSSGVAFRTLSGSPERAPRDKAPAAPRRTRTDNALKFALVANDLYDVQQILDADTCASHLPICCGRTWMTPVEAAIHYKCSVPVLTALLNAGADTTGALTALVKCCSHKDLRGKPRDHGSQLAALPPNPTAYGPFASAPEQLLIGFSIHQCSVIPGPSEDAGNPERQSHAKQRCVEQIRSIKIRDARKCLCFNIPTAKGRPDGGVH